MGAREPAEIELQGRLDLARTWLDIGNLEAARDLASAVLAEAEAQQDIALQAQALMALAQYDRITGNFRRGIDAAQRAVLLLQRMGDIAGEAQALSLLALANSYLGREEEAVEAGLLSVRLGDLLPPGPQQINFYNYLGVAYLWARGYGCAESALREAERLALLYGAQGSVLLPRINLAWLECVRLSKERYFVGKLPDTASLRQRLRMCDGLFDDDQPFPGLPGVKPILQRFGRCAWALLHCWEGDIAAGQAQFDAARDPGRPGGHAQVANFIVHWVEAELNWARGAPAAACDAAVRLIELSSQAEFEPMACNGHLLLTQIYRQQGLHALAGDEERAHRRRELRLRAALLDNRHRIVESQLEVRTSRLHLHALSKHSKELERLSYEDALTGIANRRRFEQQVAAALSERRNAQLPLCLALIDLDNFKQINDGHSHAVGDEVLRSVAQEMKSMVRTTDLPARFGGDEFVVLFPHTDVDTARQICDRIQARVAELRWPHLATELSVTISVGVAQATAGDSPADLLHRSDEAMFKQKAAPARR
jgi:diguanylate cyclase (GGDEF)-like protein